MNSKFRTLLFLVPVVGVVELGLHVYQVRSVVPDSDWVEARRVVEQLVRPDDLVAFAPKWVLPTAQQNFGDGLASLTRTARSDEQRFPRAVEVSIRGEHVAALSKWKLSEERRVGKIAIRVLDNPSPAPVVDDFVTHIELGNVEVSRDGQACPRSRTVAQTGHLGFGLAVPADRHQCASNGFVGRSVLADLEYVPRRCIYAQPSGGGSVLRVHFPAIKMGKSLVGHHAISVHQERDKTGAPVVITVQAGETQLGRATHRDGDGWERFEFDTRSFDGQTKDISVNVSSAAGGRPYCFEMTSR